MSTQQQHLVKTGHVKETNDKSSASEGQFLIYIETTDVWTVKPQKIWFILMRS